MALKSRPTPPRARLSATNGSWKSKRSYKPKSPNCLPWPSRPIAPPEGMDLPQELARREDRLQAIAEAKAVLEARAAERFAAEQAEYAAKIAARVDTQERTGKKQRGKPPTPPSPGSRDS